MAFYIKENKRERERDVTLVEHLTLYLKNNAPVSGSLDVVAIRSVLAGCSLEILVLMVCFTLENRCSHMQVMQRVR